MDIILCEQDHSLLWDAFVLRHEAASFYHRFAWKGINERCFGHETFYLAAIDNGEIRGIFPIVLLRSRIFGRILCSMPFVNLGGPCASDPEVMDALMDEANLIVSRTRAKFLEIRSPTRLKTVLPASEHKVSMTIDLSSGADQLWNAFTSKHRNNVRRAYKHGFTTRIGGLELVERCYDVLSESWRSLGTPLYAKNYFEEIARVFSDSISVVLLFQGDCAVGTAFNGHHRHTVEGMWAGSTADCRGSDSNYVLYWDMIKHYCDAGFERFHLGRSTVDTGAETFKKKWMAESTQLYWHCIAGNAGEVQRLDVNNPKFSLAIRAWRRLPVTITRRIGPVIAKAIP